MARLNLKCPLKRKYSKRSLFEGIRVIPLNPVVSIKTSAVLMHCLLCFPPEH